MMKTKKIFPFGDTIINEVNKKNWDDCTRVPEKPDFTWKGLNNLLEAERNKSRADVLKEVLELWMDCVERYGHINMMAVGNAFDRVLEQLTEKQRISSLQNSPQSSQRSSKLLVKASSTREKDSGDTNSEELNKEQKKDETK